MRVQLGPGLVGRKLHVMSFSVAVAVAATSPLSLQSLFALGILLLLAVLFLLTLLEIVVWLFWQCDTWKEVTTEARAAAVALPNPSLDVS